MTRILAMSSWVAAGHVGLSAAAPVLQALGWRTLQLPTTMLSNHTGWPAVGGAATPPEQLDSILGAIDENGWLGAVETVLIGYLPTPEHVDCARRVIERTRSRNPAARFVCDPILGDYPEGIYIREDAAEAVRERLVPLADVMTPNRFELEWLTGRPIASMDDALDGARALLGRGVASRIAVTSAPVGPNEIGVLDVTRDHARLHRVTLRTNIPKGVGDVFSALTAAGLDTAAALGHLQALIDDSLDAPALAIIGENDAWTRAAPISGEDL